MGETNTPKKFQYQEILDGLKTPCPPADFEARETLAYRWVFDTMDDPMNFVPQYVKKPKRFTLKTDSTKCLALGLSFFTSEENARLRFQKLKETLSENVWHRLETNVAKGTIQADFGVCDQPNRDGHFSFYPYDQVELKQHFNLESPL